MTFNPNDPLASMNTETGMLQDIDAIRAVGLQAVRYAQISISLPAMALYLDLGSIFDIIVALVDAEAMLTPMSQADYFRRRGELMGIDPRETDALIKEYRLSETFPITHPQATRYELPALDPNDPLVRDSRFLSELARLRQNVESEKPVEKPVEEHITLPQGMEAFLKQLGEGYSPEGE